MYNLEAEKMKTLPRTEFLTNELQNFFNDNGSLPASLPHRTK